MVKRRIPPTSSVPTLLEDMKALRHAVDVEGSAIYARWKPHIRRRPFQIGGLNLAHYLALRTRDLRATQAGLMPYGLSSLGRLESRVMPTLDSVIATLDALANTTARFPTYPRLTTFFRGERILRHNTDELFGEMVQKSDRHVRIMVTLPTEAADDYYFIRDLALRGMDVARINCAHDDPDVWDRMIQHVRKAATETRRTVKVLTDLGGPKPRTADVIGGKKAIKKGDEVLLLKTAPEKEAAKGFAAATRCTIPEVIDQLSVGHRVWIDDGKLGAVVDRRVDNGVVLRITHARPDGDKIKLEKGLNFPDTYLTLSPLTDEDLDALDTVATRADMIGYSFVQEADDVHLLQHELMRRTPEPNKVGIIAKVETPRAISNLPALIAAGASENPFGVMIARGDLAIEVGYERTAEMQEEIMWVCEAAHVPVIWATQVLERFVKEGMPSRGEMTDAAMSVRAECVMLNKGAFVSDAVTILDDLLKRMQSHQSKKTPQLRALRTWADYTHEG